MFDHCISDTEHYVHGLDNRTRFFCSMLQYAETKGFLCRGKIYSHSYGIMELVLFQSNFCDLIIVHM